MGGGPGGGYGGQYGAPHPGMMGGPMGTAGAYGAGFGAAQGAGFGSQQMGYGVPHQHNTAMGFGGGMPPLGGGGGAQYPHLFPGMVSQMPPGAGGYGNYGGQPMMQ